jgi:hypothetical protein
MFLALHDENMGWPGYEATVIVHELNTLSQIDHEERFED